MSDARNPSAFAPAAARLLRERAGAALALMGLCLLFGALSDRFFEVDNFVNVARQISLNAVVAVGMTLVIVSGGIDLSVGSVVALSSCVTGLLMAQGAGVPASLGAGLAIGLACGLANGLVITRLGISPFIASLGMMSVARGAALVLTDGNPVTKLSPSFLSLGTSSWLGVPTPVWVMASVAVAGGFVLSRTRLGRYALALGSNEEAARLSGIPVRGYKLTLYVLMGALAAVAGFLLSARVASADPSSGMLMELEAIAAVVIGGASLKGGRGSVLGTVLGAAIMGVLNNGLVLLGISAFWQQVLVGAVIIAAVAVDGLRTRTAGQPRRARWVRGVGYAAGGALAAAALLAMVLRPDASAPKAPGAAEAKKVFAVVGKASGGEYWLQVKAGAERQGQKLGVDVLWLGTPAETDVAKQIDLLENLIQRRVDGIAVAPTDAHALSPVIKKALDAGIPVITVDSDAQAKDRLSYVGTDNRQAGVEAGKEMVQLLGGKGKVAIVTGVLGAQNLRQRCEGFKAGAAGSGLELLPEQTDAGDRAKALAIAENLLTAHPDLAGFFTDTAIGGPAVAQALLARGKAGQVKLVSFDTTPALLEYLEKGVAHGLVAQKPERMGELAVELLLQRTRGETLPPVVDTGVGIVRKQPGTVSAEAN